MSSPSDCADPVKWRYDPVDNHTDWPYHAHASLAIPIDAEELLFKAEGSRAHGTFEVSQSTDTGTKAVVDIDVVYRSEDALDEAKVCHLSPSENKHGLGIFTERWNHPEPHRQLRFHVHVHLPATEKGDPRTINAFNTHLPLFAHHLSKLADTVVFKSISLATSNSALRADSLRAEIGKLRSSNGKIEGTFNTSKSLELRTSNAPIHVTANLINSNKDAGTVLTADTSNGAIQAHVGLFVRSVDGAFRVNTRTTNAVARVTVTDAPANSLLNASAVSSNAPVSFEAHAAFEGTFELYSARFSPPTVKQPHPVEDPLGKGRNRTVQVNPIGRGAIRGEVDWEPKHEKAKSGHIRLKTSNAGASLVL
ncbi:uncharacterized protein TRAVEDRAFT_132071 [Trametes versicolor FP-101664 SS1]|uniref:uncharacterized protein n=1 Tax=Trametes versicolor (strain FP-101664) TaxID=717944 RepID=UPI0004622FC3|nr:uncharacterized protein TRAVEDRAFT_132071 [Trametes versicolor FP-101664 SS1]EIW54039.1 hypothetical protein TRAVEDRAFT_132071 [Trametes versicolor FP-101664 SS1]